MNHASDLCRTPKADLLTPWGSIQSRLRTTGLIVTKHQSSVNLWLCSGNLWLCSGNLWLCSGNLWLCSGIESISSSRLSSHLAQTAWSNYRPAGHMWDFPRPANFFSI